MSRKRSLDEMLRPLARDPRGAIALIFALMLPVVAGLLGTGCAAAEVSTVTTTSQDVVLTQ
jgi:Flp pilus assembly protein TadG